MSLETLNQRPIIVTGLLGSGKSELSKGLADQYGSQYINFGDLLIPKCVELGIKPDVTQVTGMDRMNAYKQVTDGDPDYFKKLVSGNVIIDGPRHLHDVEDAVTLRGAQIISLVAPRPVRLLRRIGLDPTKDPDFDSMVSRELTELNQPSNHEGQMLKIMALASQHGILIDATMSPEEVFTEASAYVSTITPKPA